MYLLGIEEHIDRLLSTTKNTLVLAPHVGLSPIFIDRVAVQDDLILDLKEEVLENIENFEPRVQSENIAIVQEGDDLMVSIRTADVQKNIKL
ncbi:hypothetical protein NHP200010_09810 [Helicobacter bizzozeronii]|uniref:GPW/gp25 family protein n=1 Tax=Helicobacter bizzozeronii TaxID=56877 RepID=UPI00244D9124|nr:GPW/gp25 family protein [Helicobacter bizzozeronii]GMB93267.1 hypothetical protein NHP200010_09810 [Helicobacter bizzozeronii]